MPVPVTMGEALLEIEPESMEPPTDVMLVDAVLACVLDIFFILSGEQIDRLHLGVSYSGASRAS